MKVDFFLAVETEQILVMGTNQIFRNSCVVWLINWSEQYFLRDSHRISLGFSDLSTVPDFGAIPDVSEKCPDVQIYRSIYYFILQLGPTCFNNCSQPKKTNYFFALSAFTVIVIMNVLRKKLWHYNILHTFNLLCSFANYLEHYVPDFLSIWLAGLDFVPLLE